ncbi:MAG: glycosyl hydrolase family 28-related protein [Sedimentisphaerales bacterium]|nr:glycosyl hydrolase family 28-related protein [Sedimentisphaerales bacterium]
MSTVHAKLVGHILAVFAIFVIWPVDLLDLFGGQSYYPSRLDDPRAVYLTKDQFDVHADGLGDDANSLQEAINRVQETARIGVVFIPEGRYRLGKTVYVWQGIRLIGYGRKRPVFVLGRDTPGFQEGTGKYMIHFADYRPGPGRPFSDGTEMTFYSGISNIDFEIEEGNPAAIAIRFHVAQHCFLRHIDFHIGSAKAAIEEIGNQASDLHIYGGQYGIITKRTAPVWQFLLMDCSFEGQRESAIHTMEAGFTLIRVRFAHMPIAIQIAPGEVEQLYGRDLRMEDITIAALKTGNVRNTHSEVTLTNIACSDVPCFYKGDQTVPAPSRYYVVDRFMIGLQIGEDGREQGIQLRHKVRSLSEPAPVVASDIPALPPMDRWVNVRELNVKGDGRTDDTEAIRAAISEHQVLFFPSGTYRVSGSIELGPDTILIGLHPGNTVISLANGSPGFEREGEPLGVLVAPRGGRNIIVSIGVVPGANRRAAGIVWMAGNNSMLDDVSFPPGGGFGFGQSGGAQGPDLLIKDGGGIIRGNWPHNTSCRTAGLRIENTSSPGRIYQISVEHHMNVEAQFYNVQNWEFYALQTEEENPAGHRAIAMEIKDCRNLLFANTFMYRVSRTTLPMTYGAIVSGSDDIRFENMKVFSQTRLAFDNAILEKDSNVSVRSHFFTNLVVNKQLKAPAPLPLPAVFNKGSKLERLAEGFSNASGLTTDDKGRLFFTDAAMHAIYRWNEATRKAEQIATIQGQPMVMGFARPSSLLIVAYERAVYSLDLSEDNAEPRPVAEVTDKLPDTSLLLPVGLHNMLSILNDLMERRDYLYRQGSNTAIIRVIEGAHRGYFYAPGSRTAILAGGTWRPILQSSNLALFSAGDLRYVTSEDDGKTYLVELRPDERLAADVFVERGGTSVVEDLAGNVYIASDQVYIYNKQGNQIGIVEIPERPGSLAIGGPDRLTLFIGARGSLYAIRLAPSSRRSDLDSAQPGD